MANWRLLAEQAGHELVESLAAFAQPAGPTVRQVYEALRDEILEAAEAALPLDIVLLGLHGAMVAEGYDDCEGDLIARLREVVGEETFIGAELDLHCHLSRAMVAGADCLIAYKHYPHTDIAERACELFAIAERSARGEVQPVTAVYDCAMSGMWRTSEPAMAEFVQAMKRAEMREEILSVSLAHGFPWGDVSDAGAKLWVVADGDRKRAVSLARELGERFTYMRDETAARQLGMADALDRAESLPGPVVIADIADNAGGGAPGDSTFILEEMLARGLSDVVTGCYWDSQAVRFCMEAGQGARLALRIGGKTGPASGDPVDLDVEVMALAENHAQTGLGEMTVPLGPSAWVRAKGVDIVLTGLRSQVFAPDAFTGLGIDLGAAHIVVVKSTQHFHAAFAPLASDILYAETPGALSMDFANIPYRKRSPDFWPNVAEPPARPVEET